MRADAGLGFEGAVIRDCYGLGCWIATCSRIFNSTQGARVFFLPVSALRFFSVATAVNRVEQLYGMTTQRHVVGQSRHPVVGLWRSAFGWIPAGPCEGLVGSSLLTRGVALNLEKVAVRRQSAAGPAYRFLVLARPRPAPAPSQERPSRLPQLA